MEFDKSRCYSALNADELRAGDKVIVADDLVTLKRCVKDSSHIDTIRMIGKEDYIYRFGVKDNTATFALACLVERGENCTNCGEGRWDAEHKKILCDPVHCGNGNVIFRNHEIEVCEYWKPQTKQKAEKHTDYNHCEEDRAIKITQAFNMAIEALERTEWHYPAKSEVPEKDGEYYIAVKIEDGGFITALAIYDVDRRKWLGMFNKPYAWCYLPDLPKEEA